MANDLHYAGPETLPWGDPRNPVDDPRCSDDITVTPGVERVTANEIGANEQWVVAAEVRNLTTPESIRATANIYRDGVLQFSGELRPASTGFWVIASVSAEATTAIDTFQLNEPGCEAPAECDGRVATAEMCNGIDDDCDGAIDEHPETCANEVGRPIDAACVYVGAGSEEPYRCVEI